MGRLVPLEWAEATGPLRANLVAVLGAMEGSLANPAVNWRLLGAKVRSQANPGASAVAMELLQATQEALAC